MKIVAFMGEEYATPYDMAKIVIFPVPFDGTSTYGKGADKGPTAILTASQFVEPYDIETASQPHMQGICTMPPLAVYNNTDPETVVKLIQKKTAQFLRDEKFVVMLGGEHSISTGLARALFEKYQNLSVLHFDAHGDTREIYKKSKYNHACVMARIRELCIPIVQVGIRSVDKEEIQTKKKNQFIYWAHDINKNNAWMSEAISHLTDNVFITIDLDVFDPAIMPSTGTPEPGGMNWYQVLQFLQCVIKKKSIVGFDVVELAPFIGNTAPDFMAAKLIYRILSMVFEKQSHHV